ncbi:MAG: tape measure protein, partial [Holophaga sp.]|nr:tape measure protein [Holophaga sp.]
MAETVRTLRVELAAGVAGFQQGFKNAAGSVDGLALRFEALNKQLDKGASQQVAKFADAIGSRLQGVGVALSAALTAPIVALGAFSLQAAAGFQQTEIAFTTMLGSGEKAKAFLDELEAFAARTPFQFNDLVDASKRMLALGFTSEQVIPTLTAIGDAAAGLGGGKELIDGITLALGQMSAKGKVSAQEMNQLAERGVPAWSILAKTLGITIPEAMKKAEAGAISASVAVPAILQGMSEKFGGLMDKQSETLLGRWSTVKDEFSFIVRDIGTALLPIATALVEAFSSALPYVRAAVEAFAALSPTVQGIIVGFAALAAALGPAAFILGTVATGFGALVAAGPVLLPILGMVAGAAIAIGIAFVACGGSIEGLIKGFFNLTAVAMDAVGGIVQGMEWLMEGMGKMPFAMGQPFRDAAASLQEFRLNMAGAAESVRAKGAQIAEGFGKSREELGKAKDNVKALAEAFKGMGGPPPLDKKAKKLAEDAEKLQDQLNQAFSRVEAKGDLGLSAAFEKIDAEAQKWTVKLRELVEDGLSPQAAAGFRAEIDALTATMRANAVEAERQKVLGETFRDLAREAQNLRDVLDATGGDLTQLTDASLAKLEAHLTDMAKAGAPVEGTLERVRARMEEVGLATTETQRQHERYTEAQEYHWSMVEAQEEAAAAA